MYDDSTDYYTAIILCRPNTDKGKCFQKDGSGLFLMSLPYAGLP